MPRSPRIAILAAVFLLGLAGAATGCSRATVPGSARPLGPTIDQPLLNAAITAEVNHQRCRHGLGALGSATALQGAARAHADWMAGASTLSHKSTYPGRSTVRARILATGLKVRRGSENIARVPLFPLDLIDDHLMPDAATCHIVSRDGTPLPPHSYASLAREAVALWMASPRHRARILDRDVTVLASAGAVDTRGGLCGTLYLAQKFAG